VEQYRNYFHGSGSGSYFLQDTVPVPIPAPLRLPRQRLVGAFGGGGERGANAVTDWVSDPDSIGSVDPDLGWHKNDPQK
jgi:hypothetical protein